MRDRRTGDFDSRQYYVDNSDRIKEESRKYYWEQYKTVRMRQQNYYMSNRAEILRKKKEAYLEKKRKRKALVSLLLEELGGATSCA